METLMWSKIILNPKEDNLENGFLKPEYPFNFALRFRLQNVLLSESEKLPSTSGIAPDFGAKPKCCYLNQKVNNSKIFETRNK